MRLTGIEIVPETITCARQSAAQLGLNSLHFQALDLTQFATREDDIPQPVLVNPSRRGIDTELRDYSNHVAPPYIIYPNCDAHTTTTDTARFRGYRVRQVRLSGMLPHAAHYEVLTLLVHEV